MISVSTSAVPDVPKGAPFLIDRCPFRPGLGIEYAALDIPDDKVFNWPMVYILSNKDEA